MKRRPDDEGAVLILVLIVISVVAVVLGALLTYADTSLRTTINLRDQASAGADADGAVQAAINNLRNGTSTASGNCFGSSNTLTLPSFEGTTSAAVKCSSDPSTAVRIQCPSLSNCNRPGNAILTLGTAPGEDGLKITQPNSATSTFRVHGGIYSNSTINVTSGSVTASSGVYAKGACIGTIQSTPPPQCSSSAANPLGDDPGYAPKITTAPALQPLPACTTKNSVVKFSPGYYDDAAKLSDMMTNSSKCSGSLWWFQPGTYYFDFHNSGTNNNPLLDYGSNVWTINDGTLVAGVPTGTLSASTAIPGACINPIDNPNASGVQFIFGGDSQMVVKAGQAEICGGWNTDSGAIDPTKPPVAVYGLTSGTESTTTKTLAVTSVPAADDYKTATVADLGAIGGTAAGYKSTNGQLSGKLTVGVTPTTAIPVGSILKSATVRVVHHHEDTANADSLKVTLTPTGGTAAATTLIPGEKGGSSWYTDTTPVALTTAVNGLAGLIYAGTFTGAQIEVTSTVGDKNDTESIDAIQLDLSYVTPALRAETGCVTTGLNAGGCSVITTTNSPGSQFYVQGTTYTPKAALDISLNNLSEQVFRFGVISRSLQIKQTGSFAYIGPVIEVPDDAPGFAYAVYLTAYVCPGSATCSTTGSPSLRAKVAIVDANPSAPVAGKRQIAILNWTPTG
ncbi:hypothetical protein ODJ79_11700 [Actinoplanes sp. KI2]|uniref:hypothetical protein n=1 Tax=Actinoplanes sp. KI2 TaxID=2983315 RepID=UPI0021D5DD9B|nr:hypothetical protein [Actinoplanes sp. KI2]MCU7724381.1 hypothetical protein [Actinoplanes sp. KI2]